MNRLIVLIAAAGVAMSMFSAGAAGAQGAPDVTGQKYSEAAATLKNAGFTAQLATTVGDQLSQADCLVSSQAVLRSTSSFGPYQFNAGGGGNIVMLSLNCDANQASAGNAGYSAASPEGREIKAKKEKDKLDWEMTPSGKQWCAQAKTQHPEWGWKTDPSLANCGSGG